MAEMSLGDFNKILAKVGEELEGHVHKALERVAEHIERDAKARIGHYNGPAGPFAAWAPLAESTIQDRAAKGFAPDEPLLRTGELRESIERHVGKHEAVIGSDSAVAVAQELGTTTIPPRSFLGAAGAASLPLVHAEFGGAIVTAVRNAKAGGT